MATIIQDYGPIYGDVVNGTVQGRPNGSVYVPISNTIMLRYHNPSVTTSTVSKNAAGNYLVSKGYDIVAQSQDLASYMRIGIYTDAECTTLFAINYGQKTAGIFNVSNNSAVSGPGNTDDPTPGTTYYLRAELVNNGTVVAASTEILETVGA